MKICLISPPLLLTPPIGYGGLERVVYDLGCALVGQDHEVTLVAPKGSKIEGAETIETIDACGTTGVDWARKEADAYDIYNGRLKEFDIVHDHTWFGFPYMAKMESSNKDVKLCHTHHGHLDWNPSKVPPQIGKINLIGISDFMQKEYSARGWGAKFVYNGIDNNKYPPGESARNGRLVFVGRISKLKMPHAAIKAAIESNTPIDVIGGTFVDDQSFVELIKKECENSNGLATLHLDATNEEKLKILRSASACLVPSQFKEPYGLVATESLSCGTPVIAYDDGALKEIINSGKVGTVCKNYDAFLEAVKNLPTAKYDTEACVQRAAYFSRENMADRYTKLYKEVIGGGCW